jgi:hypothetical protein
MPPLIPQELPPRELIPEQVLSDSPEPRRINHWSKEEYDKLFELINTQDALAAVDVTQPKPGSGKYWQLIRSQLQSFGYTRSADSCSSHWYSQTHKGSKKANAGNVAQANVAIPSLPASRHKRPLLGRDGFVDSSTITFNTGELRKQPSKKPRTSSDPKSTAWKASGIDFSRVKYKLQHPASRSC